MKKNSFSFFLNFRFCNFIKGKKIEKRQIKFIQISNIFKKNSLQKSIKYRFHLKENENENTKTIQKELLLKCGNMDQRRFGFIIFFTFQE